MPNNIVPATKLRLAAEELLQKLDEEGVVFDRTRYLFSSKEWGAAIGKGWPV